MDEHLTTAVIAYLRKRGQMDASKAAAHVVQQFGVTPDDLAHALDDERLAVVRAHHAERPADEQTI